MKGRTVDIPGSDVGFARKLLPMRKHGSVGDAHAMSIARLAVVCHG